MSISAKPFKSYRGLKVSGSKKDLTKALQEAMRAEEEKDGGQSHKVCRSEDCQCVKDGASREGDKEKRGTKRTVKSSSVIIDA